MNRAEKRFYPLKKRYDHGHYGLLVDTAVKDCTKVVTLRGIIQVIILAKQVVMHLHLGLR